MPSTLESKTRASAFSILAIKPDNSSLSVNINSVRHTVSFSLTIGITQFSNMMFMQAFWFWYCSLARKFSFIVSTCPTLMPYSLNKS